MVNVKRRLLGLVVGLLWLPLLACSFSWQVGEIPRRAERPSATSTPAPAPQPGKRPAGLLALTPEPAPPLSTEAQLAQVIVPTRDLRDLAMRFKPEVGEIPLVAVETPVTYQVGDHLAFWVHDVTENRNFQITAELVARTDVAYAWVEVGRPVERTALIRSVEHFSTDIYPKLVEFFGPEWNPGVDGDPRLHILHAYGLGDGIAGYFSSIDEYSRLAHPFSNEKEMFYISLEWLNRTRDFEYYETVLAHEFQHMIHWYNDRNEETWVNEGLSEYAQEVVGYAPDLGFVRSFVNNPDTQLTTWSPDMGFNDAHYGAAYLFVSYFAQRFGAEVTQAVVANPANGTRGFDAALAPLGLNFDAVFADWVVANYLDDPNALDGQGRLGYFEIQPPAPVLDQVHSEYPTELRRSTVHNYATDYILLEGQGDVTLYFQGQTETRLARAEPFSGHYAWWSNRGDDTNSRLTRRFDLSALAAGTPVEMQVAMWWDIEKDYDYGYVGVSRDGRHWELLSGQYTQPPDVDHNALGPAYTGTSPGEGDAPGWVQETFDLSPYAGQEIWVRFEYITDDAVNNSGWLIDDVQIPALDYTADFENGADGWESEGWLLTDGRLRQRWLLQILHLQDNRLQELERFTVDEAGRATIPVDGLGGGRTAVLAISALAPITTEPAAYEYRIEPRDEPSDHRRP